MREVSVGPHFFETAILFINSMLLNSMLCITEALLGITQLRVEKLEQDDRIFFRRLFEVPRCTTIESFYIETSTIPVHFLLVSRRLLYYWSILQKDEEELVKKVFNAQKSFPVKNDWIHQIQNELETCGIEESEDDIKKKSLTNLCILLNFFEE